MSEQKKLMPQLRFPEFRKAEGWELKRLGSVGQLTRGLTYSSDNVASAGLLVLRSTNIQNGSLVLDSDLVFVEKQCPEALRLQTGDIVICMSNGSKALVGKSGEYSGEYEGDITVGAFCSFFRPASPFVKVAFHLNSYQKYIADLIAGGNINNLTNSVLEEFTFPVPLQPAEQQKIADCLSSLDELIAAQGRKVEALKTHKKGLMQQLFPREGETQPRLRFPEYKNSGDWVVKRLAGLIDLISGMHLSPEDYSTFGEVPYFSGPSDFTNDLQTVTKWTKRTANVSQFNDTLITVKGSGVGEIWSSTLPEVALGRQLMAIRPKNCSSRFIFQFLLTKRSRFEDLGSGNLIPGLSRAAILELDACLPSPDEQKRIADFLVSLDALITSASQDLDALKIHKKGLMQQLFPSMEAVNA